MKRSDICTVGNCEEEATPALVVRNISTTVNSIADSSEMKNSILRRLHPGFLLDRSLGMLGSSPASGNSPSPSSNRNDSSSPNILYLTTQTKRKKKKKRKKERKKE